MRGDIGLARVERLDDLPTVRKARKRREAVEVQLDAVRERLAEAEHTLATAERREGEALADGRPAGHAGIADVRRALERAEGEVRIAQAGLASARERERLAREDAADELRSRLMAEYAEAIVELNRRLLAARETNGRVRELWEVGLRVLGEANAAGRTWGVVDASFGPLGATTAQQSENRHDVWRAFVERELGIDLARHA